MTVSVYMMSFAPKPSRYSISHSRWSGPFHKLICIDFFYPYALQYSISDIDFTHYYVSNFSRELLSRISLEPLFNVAAIHPQLHRRVRALDQVREARVQLRHLVTFLAQCRHGQPLHTELLRLAPHITKDVDLYSLHELSAVRSGELLRTLRLLVNRAVTHVSSARYAPLRALSVSCATRPET